MRVGQLLTSVAMLQTHSNTLKTGESEHREGKKRREGEHPGIVTCWVWTQLQDTPPDRQLVESLNSQDL